MIQVENVSKRYGQRLAVDCINFTVNRGEILGFLGPNGAGKTTTMNIISGYISATEGSVRVDGLDILEAPLEVKRKIGYLPELPPLYPEMTVQEYLDFVSEVKKVAVTSRQGHLDQIVELVQLGDVRSRIIKNLSKGYKQRVGLAQALIGSPEVLILDEPTVGLDPKQIIEIRNVIKELGKEHTIILSSHILPEVSMICDRVIIINQGHIVASDTPDNLSRNLAVSHKLALRVEGSGETISSLLRALPGVKDLEVQGIREPGTVDVLVEAEKDVDLRRAIFEAVSGANHPLLMMRSLDLTLEDIFLQVTQAETVPVTETVEEVPAN